MTPEQIHAMIKAAVEASGGPAWWVYLMLIVGAGLASFFGSYLGEKAKNTATKEDIAAITTKVESVKQTLASRGWVRQQHWANREKHYLQILTQLSIMRSAAIDSFNEISRHEADDGSGPTVAATHGQKDYKSAKVKLVELLGPAAVFISQPALDSLYQLLKNERDLNDDPMWEKEFYDSLSKSVSHAFDTVLDIAQKELKESEESA